MPCFEIIKISRVNEFEGAMRFEWCTLSTLGRHSDQYVLYLLSAKWTTISSQVVERV